MTRIEFKFNHSGFSLLATLISTCWIFAQPASAAPVTLLNATATVSQGGFPVSNAVDGSFVNGTGWATNSAPSIGVFETSVDLALTSGLSTFTFTLQQNYGSSHMLGNFRFSATDENRANYADGLANGGNVGLSSIWTVLDVTSASTLNGTVLTVQPNKSILASSATTTDTYTITATTFLSNITGLRLELLEHPSLFTNGPGTQGNGNLVLNEMVVDHVFLPIDETLISVANTNWNTNSTWDLGTMAPDSGSAVIIDGETVTVDGTGSPQSAFSLNISSGTLSVDSGANLSIVASSTTVAGTLDVNGTGIINAASGLIVNGGTVDVSGTTSAVVASSAAFDATSSLNLSGGSFNADHLSFSGTANITGGTLNASESMTLNADLDITSGNLDVSTANVTVNTGADLSVNQNLTAKGLNLNGGTLTRTGVNKDLTVTESLVIANSSSNLDISDATLNAATADITVNTGADLTINQNLTAKSLTLNGGTLTRTGANQDVTVTGGLTLSGNSSLDVSGGPVLTTTGSNVNISSGSTLTTDNQLNVNGLDVTGTLNRTGGSVATRAVNVAGGGYFYLSGQDMDFTGETFTLGANAALRVTNGRTLTVPDSTFIANSGSNPNTLQLSSLWVQNSTLAVSGTKDLTVAGEMRFDNVVVPHNISGGGYIEVGLASNNTGLVELTGTNSHTNITRIRRGTLRIDSPTSLSGSRLDFQSGQAGPINNNTGALLAILEGNGTFARNTGSGVGQVYWMNNGGFGAYGGEFIVTLDGGATLNWGANPQGFVTQRQLQLNGPNSNSTVIFTNDINVNPSGNIAEIHTTQGVGNAKAIMSGSFSAPDSARTLRFTGTGILELTGSTNNFASNIQINGSTVRVLGDLNTAPGQSITIGSNAGIGGRLEHGGNSGGSVIVNNLGQLAPGNSPGTFTVDGDLTINSGGIYHFELGLDRLINLGSDDLIDVVGTATLNSGWILKLTDSYGANPDGDPIKILEFGSLGTLGLVNIDASDLLTNSRYSFGSLSVTQIGNALYLNGLTSTSAVPEPGSATLLLLGAIALPYLRRKRRRA